MTRVSFSLQIWGGDLSYERFFTCFQGDREEGQSVILASALLQVTVIQNNQYALEAHLGVACPGSHGLTCMDSGTAELMRKLSIIELTTTCKKQVEGNQRGVQKSDWMIQGKPRAGGFSSKDPACQCRRPKRHRSDPWVKKNPLEEGMATFSSILAWRISWTEESM